MMALGIALLFFCGCGMLASLLNKGQKEDKADVNHSQGFSPIPPESELVRNQNARGPQSNRSQEGQRKGIPAPKSRGPERVVLPEPSLEPEALPGSPLDQEPLTPSAGNARSAEEERKQRELDERIAEQEPAAAEKLKFAKELHRNGMNDLAKRNYAVVVKNYPGTKAANEAKELLRKYFNITVTAD